jgi:hypothetical protein
MGECCYEVADPRINHSKLRTALQLHLQIISLGSNKVLKPFKGFLHRVSRAFGNSWACTDHEARAGGGVSRRTAIRAEWGAMAPANVGGSGKITVLDNHGESKRVKNSTASYGALVVIGVGTSVIERPLLSKEACQLSTEDQSANLPSMFGDVDQTTWLLSTTRKTAVRGHLGATFSILDRSFPNPSSTIAGTTELTELERCVRVSHLLSRLFGSRIT